MNTDCRDLPPRQQTEQLIDKLWRGKTYGNLFPIGEVSRDLGLLTLVDRRFSADVVLLSKILNGKIDCPDMLSQILFRTPSATRSRDLFARQQHRTNHAANDTMYRLQSSGNSVADIVDFFVDSIPVLKRRIAGLHELSA
ncbi:hypothetical protein J6590_028148 [Homalodisca vitripennis]|nr:hypothetical protein J6590_091171 [Homalodisca vitripennis]KAG8332163.1 hypothetical protein J6590_028148 [Homalodisca vitripennis]